MLNTVLFEKIHFDFKGVASKVSLLEGLLPLERRVRGASAEIGRGLYLALSRLIVFVVGFIHILSSII